MTAYLREVGLNAVTGMVALVQRTKTHGLPVICTWRTTSRSRSAADFSTDLDPKSEPAECSAGIAVDCAASGQVATKPKRGWCRSEGFVGVLFCYRLSCHKEGKQGGVPFVVCVAIGRRQWLQAQEGLKHVRVEIETVASSRA